MSDPDQAYEGTARRAHDYASNIVASVRVPLLVLDSALHVKTASLAFYETFQLTPEATLGKSIYELSNGEWSFPELRDLLEVQLPREITVDHFELSHTFDRIGSREMLLRACRLPQAAASRQLVVLSIEDITERSRAEKALQKSEEYNRTIVESSRDCIKILDPEGTLLLITPTGQRLLCIDNVDDYLGKSWINTWIGEDRAAARAAVEAAAAGGTGSFVGQFFTGRGESQWWDVRVTPIQNESRIPERLLVVSRDVTESRRREINIHLLSQVDQELSRLTGTEDIIRCVGEKIGPHLGLSSCVFVEIDEAAAEMEVTSEWRRDEVPPTLGKHRLDEYFTQDFQITSRAGETFVVSDTATDPRTTAEHFGVLKIRSFLCVPLIRDGGWRFTFSVRRADIHEWRDDEVDLMTELTMRIWAHLQRAGATIALRHSEKRFRVMVNAMPQLGWIAQADGHIFWYNQRWHDYTGTTPEEMDGWGWQKVHHPETLPEVLEKWQESISSGNLFEMTFPLRGADGRFRQFFTRVIPLTDAEGKVLHWFGTNTDVSKMLETEEDLRRAHLKLQNVLGSITDGLAIMDTEWRFTYFSEQGARMLGVRVQDMLGGLLLERFPLAADGKFFAEFQRAFDTRQPVHFEEYYPEPLNIWLECHCYPSDEGLSVYFQDVTERKQAEEVLRQNAELVSRMVDQAPTGMYVVDSQFRLQQVNARALPIFKNVDPLIGRDLAEVMEILWGAEVGGQCAAILRHTLATGEHYVSPYFAHHRADLGMEEAYEWETQRVTLHDGQYGVICYFHNVTERHAQEQAMRALVENLDQAARSKDEFLAMLAHELRNPLAPLQNAAEILKSTAATDGARGEAQRVIGRQIENMTRMIDDLLDVSRITQGKIVLRQNPVELQSILTTAAKIAQRNGEGHGQTLTVSLPEESIYLNGDSTRLDQVFGNLLGNACKYSGSGSHIHLAAEVVSKHEVAIRISDDGIGIDPELLPTIFELFVQSSRTLDRSHGGLGIGLTIVHRLVTMHGGSVEVRSDGLGHGCVFIVRLPIIRPPAAPLPEAKVASATVASCRMLIVDDSHDAAQSMAMLQTLLGHETRVAHSGPDALEIAADFLPQVVLLDIGLPGMDGFEVARRLRTLPALENAFLVAISGYSTEDDRRKSKAAGFDEHLAKPADFNLLHEWLRIRL